MKYNDPNEYWWREGEGDGMEEEERLKVAIVQGLTFVTMLIVLLALCALLGSCTTTRVVTVEKVRTDTLRENRIERDSIWLHDSIHIREKGDTVIIERWHTKWQNHLEHDTVYKSRTDSVPVPYPVIQEVAKPLTVMQKWLMGLGGFTLLGLIVVLAWKVKKFLP